MRAKTTEANTSGIHAAVTGRRSNRPARSRLAPSPIVLRMPSNYTARDVEVILDALWKMFTESQARKVKVLVPWDDSEEPQQMTVVDLATLLESWIA